jgi:hypothetical protein
MHGLVRQHGLADDVANGKNVGHGGAHLEVDINKTSVRHSHTGFVGTDLLAKALGVLYTVPISSPMMPPPRMSMRLGASLSSNAPVESTKRRPPCAGASCAPLCSGAFTEAH